MIPLLNRELPHNVAKQILLEATDQVGVLTVYQQVSKGFKHVADDAAFQYSLLIKLKGDSFSDSSCKKSPKKFLILDPYMMGAFQIIVYTNNWSESEWANIKLISAFKLHDLNSGLGTINFHSGQTPRYFKISKLQLENLKAVDITKQDEWKRCLKDLVMSIIKDRLPYQLCCRVSEEDQTVLLPKVEALFLNPTDRMKQLITDYEITNVFCVSSKQLIVHAYKGSELEVDMLLDVLFEQYKILNLHKALCDLFIELESVVLGCRQRFNLNTTRYQTLRGRLKELNSQQKELLATRIHENGKFILGQLFPDVLPNMLEILGEEKENEILNYWYTKAFVSTIKLEETSPKRLNLEFDVQTRALLLNRFANPAVGLKQYIERTCEGNELLLLKDIIFREVWHGQAFDSTKPYTPNQSSQ